MQLEKKHVVLGALLGTSVVSLTWLLTRNRKRRILCIEMGGQNVSCELIEFCQKSKKTKVIKKCSFKNSTPIQFLTHL